MQNEGKGIGDNDDLENVDKSEADNIDKNAKNEKEILGNSQPIRDTSGFSALFATRSKVARNHLYFKTREDWIGAIPKDQHRLMLEFEKVSDVLRSRFLKNETLFEQHFYRLLSLAQATFNGRFEQTEAGTKSLDDFKLEIILAEGAAIKNEHLKKLALAALYANMLIVVAFVIFQLLSSLIVESDSLQEIFAQETITTPVVQDGSINLKKAFSMNNFALLLMSTMWGIWLSFSIRNIELRFEQLQTLDNDLLQPWSRLLTYGMVALIVAMFFDRDAVAVSIGSISTNAISEDPYIAILIGFSLGFSDKMLPSTVVEHIEKLIKPGQNK